MSRIFIALLLFTAPLIAQEEMMVVDSLFADYNGKRITLTGSVVVEHELGKICANKMVMTPTENDKKLRFAALKIKDNVTLTLKDGGQLCCGIADLNYKALTGLFTGNSPEEYVVYTDLCHEKGGVTTPVIMKSRQMGVVIAREPLADTTSFKSRIAHINTEEDVTVNYNQDFLVTADRCHYKRMEGEDAAEIVFLSLREEGNCKVSNKRGDLIHAKEIKIHTADRTLAFVAPKGTLLPPLSHHEIDPLLFSAESMRWEDAEGKMLLKDAVELTIKGVGTLLTDKQMELIIEKEGEQKQLGKVNITGNTSITRLDEEKQLNYRLTTSGDVNFDMHTLQLSLDRPADGTQIHYQDDLGELFSDHLTFDFTKEGTSIVPSFLVLKGNVRLINRFNDPKTLSNPLTQYALADRIEIHPHSKEAHLTAKKNKRVLFYDKVNNINMSAPSFKVVRDQVMKKHAIHGMGDVRLRFVEQEIEQLKKRFNFESEEGAL